MSIFNRQTKQETIIYTIVWSVLFLSPLIDLLFHYDDQSTGMVRHSLIDTWASLLSFFVVFIIHNHVLAPMLVKHKKVKLYLVGCVAVIALFQLSHCIHKPNRPFRGPHPVAQQSAILSPPPPMPNGEQHPPIDRHDISVFTIVILMIGANLGCKIYFQNEEEKKHIAKLKEQSLKQELDYLRYQINPHFIMNTLNNIHALVDIDPEQAKDSIVDISRMMRYLLYESDKQYVTINNAVTFLKKYINLMKLRYTDQVTVNLDVPSSCNDDIVIAPLVFIPFVENAFKHGVAYDKPSIIDIDIEHSKGRLLFHCRNIKNNVKHEYGGVGLNNVTKRLELIYGNDYSLDISDNDTTYDVMLNLPALTADQFNGIDQRQNSPQ